MTTATTVKKNKRKSVTPKKCIVPAPKKVDRQKEAQKRKATALKEKAHLLRQRAAEYAQKAKELSKGGDLLLEKKNPVARRGNPKVAVEVDETV